MKIAAKMASRITGIGMPYRDPRPITANIGSATVTDCAPVRIFGIDAEIPKVEKVTMKGGSLIR